MRTAIFVQQTSSATIRASDPVDASVELYRYPGGATPAVGKHTLEPGIYLIVSNSAMRVDGVHGTIEVKTNNKDEWPEVSINQVKLEPGATAASVREFLTVAKDLSLDD